MQTFLKHLHFLQVKKNITGNKLFICCLSGLDTIFFKQKTFGMSDIIYKNNNVDHYLDFLSN